LELSLKSTLEQIDFKLLWEGLFKYYFALLVLLSKRITKRSYLKKKLAIISSIFSQAQKYKIILRFFH